MFRLAPSSKVFITNVKVDHKPLTWEDGLMFVFNFTDDCTRIKSSQNLPVSSACFSLQENNPSHCLCLVEMSTKIKQSTQENNKITPSG